MMQKCHWQVLVCPWNLHCGLVSNEQSIPYPECPLPSGEETGNYEKPGAGIYLLPGLPNLFPANYPHTFKFICSPLRKSESIYLGN